jgi:hypothetical protein
MHANIVAAELCVKVEDWKEWMDTIFLAGLQRFALEDNFQHGVII